MSISKVREYLKQFQMENKIIEFDTSSATVELAANAVGCLPCRIAKTLSFMVAEKAILIVAPGDVKIDNQKFKQQFQTKAKMLSQQQVENLVGHMVGGVCPFAIKDGVEVFLDISLKRFETVFPACGSSNSAIELSIPELEKLCQNSTWVDVCKMVE